MVDIRPILHLDSGSSASPPTEQGDLDPLVENFQMGYNVDQLKQPFKIDSSLLLELELIHNYYCSSINENQGCTWFLQ